LFLFSTLFCLWFVRTTKASLFWIYLWQLKEYHLGRFLDHFRTDKGKKLFLNPVIFFKIALFFYVLFLSRSTKLLPWQLYAGWIFVLIIIYFFESIKFLKNFFQKTLKKPVLTKKTLTLISLALIVEISFLYILFQSFYLVLSPNFYWFAFSLLTFDILTPLITSIIVVLAQPFTVIFFRNKIIKKAKLRREEFKNLLVVGITGSYGKTSTKEFLAEIIAKNFKVLKTEEHQNSEVGISLCILNDLNESHDVFVCEMGAYNRGGIKLLCDIAKPKIGILTGINEQHMAIFGSQENIIRTKFELIQALPEDGLAILNGSDAKIKNYNAKFKNIKICSTKEKMDIWAENIKVDKESISFRVLSKDKKSANFKVNLLGVHNVENILMAAAAARELGMTLREISLACKKIKPEKGGMKFLKNKKGVNIIDSSYSANPNGVVADLEYLKTWEGKKIIVMPCLIELGSASINVHKKIGEKIGEVCDLAVITTKERFEEIKEGAAKSGMKAENILLLGDPKEIYNKIESFCKKGDTILLEGRLPKELINYLI